MEIFLNDGHCRENLYPFTEIRHTADIRVGILTIKEKWESLARCRVSLLTETSKIGIDPIFISANVLPTLENFQEILDRSQTDKRFVDSQEVKTITYPWQIAQLSDWAIRKDFDILTKERISAKISDSNKTINQKDIFLEEGVKMDFCILNAAEGPIYIGKNAQIMEGSMLRGPVALGEHSLVKMGSKIYNGTTIGPWCVAGGEIKNSVLFGYSNKAHDGYLGDSVIGEWCNLGAGTSNSNLKNTAGDVIFDINGTLVNAGFKAGLLMGDYSRAAINTSFNTGTIVGISCNIFGNNTPPRNIANFTWGDEDYKLDKAIRDIDNWKKLKNKNLSKEDKMKLTELYTK